MKRVLTLALLLAATLSGCFGSNGGGADDGNGATNNPYPFQRYPIPEDPMPEGAGHDHTAVAQHKFLWNYDFASRDPLMQNQANIAGVHALDLQAGYLFGAVYGSHAASVDGGMAIWDLADPAHPNEVGRWTIPGSVGGDRSLEVTPDGDFAVLATETRDCMSHVNPLGVISAYLIDTRNKARPLAVDVVHPAGTAGALTQGELGRGNIGIHSVAVHRIADRDYAFLFGEIYEIIRSETGARLDFITTIATNHDIYVRTTPWNTTWALSADGGGGMTIYDVTDPTKPFRLATWDHPEREALERNGTEYYFHTADVSFNADGKILVVLTSEDWQDHVSPLWVLDGNPLRNVTQVTEEVELEMIGEWHNPGNHTAVNTSFSLHNPRFHDKGILTISGYHTGLWQLDMRAPDFWVNPAPIAYAVYAEGDATMVQPAELTLDSCNLNFTMDAPTFMDVEIGENGTLYAADVYMGLYTFTPTAMHPVYGIPPGNTTAHVH